MNNSSMRLALTTLFALLGAVRLAESAGAQEARQRSESPFACNRLALNPEERKRHFDELGPKLRSLKKSVRELPNGYEFEFPADSSTVEQVAELAIGERACCPFFDIEMRLGPEGGSLWSASLVGKELSSSSNWMLRLGSGSEPLTFRTGALFCKFRRVTRKISQNHDILLLRKM